MQAIKKQFKAAQKLPANKQSRPIHEPKGTPYMQINQQIRHFTSDYPCFVPGYN